MLLRNPISTTKKFLQKTINSFKSLFSGGSYERIPQASPYNTYKNPYMNNKNELDKFYSDFTERYDKEKDKKKNKKKTSPPKQGLRNQSYQIKRREGERRSWMVAEKLKEIEMMDKSNVEHVLDIEEVLHYYSKLTCPAYLDIVDKFFMEIFAEIFGTFPVSTPPSVTSRTFRVSSSPRS